jgi:hypothetical protein
VIILGPTDEEGRLSEDKPGSSTFIRQLAKEAVDEIKGFRDAAQKIELKTTQQEVEFERRLNDVARNIETRFEQALQKFEADRKEQDDKHSEEIRAITGRVVELEKADAVSKARAGGTGAVAGGGIAAVLVALKTLLLG